MNILHSFTRPYYVYRPRQMIERLKWEWTKGSPNPRWITLPWKLRVRVNMADAIGDALSMTGVTDLVVTESIFRLLDQGDVAVDVGANIGYMTSAMAVCVGPSGSVLSFEPHPKLQREFRDNISDWETRGNIARGVVKPIGQALSDVDGEVVLVEPDTFQQNRGCSRIATKAMDLSFEQTKGREHQVKASRLDHAMADLERIGLLKIDAEGHEGEVLRGAIESLESGRIRDVVFEEFDAYPAATHSFLEQCGYQIFVVEEKLLGPRLLPASAEWLPPRYAPPNYLASRDPVRVRARFASRGWRCLKSR